MLPAILQVLTAKVCTHVNGICWSLNISMDASATKVFFYFYILMLNFLGTIGLPTLSSWTKKIFEQYSIFWQQMHTCTCKYIDLSPYPMMHLLRNFGDQLLKSSESFQGQLQCVLLYTKQSLSKSFVRSIEWLEILQTVQFLQSLSSLSVVSNMRE